MSDTGHAGQVAKGAYAEAMVIALGSDIDLRRRGPTAMIRALYRSGFDEGVFPVL
jgi:hypothetical protein